MTQRMDVPTRAGHARSRWVLLALAALALLATAPRAHADLLFPTTPGAGAGQTHEPHAIAVDRSDGSLYVADTANNRVDVFAADGTFLRAFGWGVADGTTAALQTCTATCFQGLPGAGAGQLKEPQDVAVDNDPASPSFHDVYILEEANSRVQKFTPAGAFLLAFGKGVNTGTSGNPNVCTGTGPPSDVCRAGSRGFAAGQFDEHSRLAIGPAGVVYVADSHLVGYDTSEITENRVQKFTPAGALIGQFEESLGNRGSPSGIAVDSLGDTYVATDDSTGAIRKYGPSGTLLNTLNPSSNLAAIATDSADHLFVVDFFGGFRGIAEYDSSGTELRVFYPASPRDLRRSLAPYSDPGGDVFALESYESTDGSKLGSILHIPIPPPGPLVLGYPGITKATALGNTKATVNTQVNPEGKATVYRFQYVDAADFEHNGEGFSSPATRETTGAAAGSDFETHALSNLIGCPLPATELKEPGNECLAPETAYHYRAIAEDSEGHISTGPEGAPFTTKAPLEIDATFATAVNTDSATLHAEVNPLTIPATGYFQYVDDATYQADLQASGPGHGFDHAGDIPAPAEPIDFGSGEAPSAAAAQLSSLSPGTTYHYRLLASDPFVTKFSSEHTISTYSPPAEAFTACPNQALRTAASAALPDCRAYEMVSPVQKGGGDIISVLSDSTGLEQAAADGQSLTYSSYRAFADPESAPFTAQYLAHRAAAGWQSESISTPREGPTFYNVHYAVEDQYRRFSSDLCSALVLTETEPLLAPKALPGYPNIYRRDNCGPDAGSYEAITTAVPKKVDPEWFFPIPQDLTPDGTHAVFYANGALTPDAVPCTKVEQGQEGCTRQLYLSNGGKLRLLCILPDGTPSVSKCWEGVTQGTQSASQRADTVYHALSTDGSRVYWTEGPTEGANGSGSGILYVRVNAGQGQSKVLAGKCTEAARACTLAVSAAAHFRTAAPDGSTAIYTASEGAGTEALYEFDLARALAGEAGASTLIAPKALNLLGASEDTTRVYFLSTEALTGENAEHRSPVAGRPNLYLHQAGPGGGLAFIATTAPDDLINYQSPSHLSARVSPGGADLAFASRAQLTEYDNHDAASGQPDTELYLYDAGEAKLRCLSCNPNGARPMGQNFCSSKACSVTDWTAATIPGWLNGTHPTSVLSTDGRRLFFESADPLILRDTNGALDVYEWQRAAGAAQCHEKGADLYSPAAAGCLSLISSGRSPADSTFVDASTDGSDVFFKTQSSLLPQDDGLIDIYDARIDGGFPPEPSPPAACEGEACQGVPAPPNDPTPASASFEGAGNVLEGPRTSCPKGKVRRKSRCVAKRHRRAAHNRHRRANDKRRAAR